MTFKVSKKQALKRAIKEEPYLLNCSQRYIDKRVYDAKRRIKHNKKKKEINARRRINYRNKK